MAFGILWHWGQTVLWKGITVLELSKVTSSALLLGRLWLAAISKIEFTKTLGCFLCNSFGFLFTIDKKSLMRLGLKNMWEYQSIQYLVQHSPRVELNIWREHEVSCGGQPGHVPGHVDRVVQAEPVPVGGLRPIGIQTLRDLAVESLQISRLFIHELIW